MSGATSFDSRGSLQEGGGGMRETAFFRLVIRKGKTCFQNVS